MTSSILLFNEHIAEASRWLTRAATVSSGSGTTTASLPLSNIFTENAAQVWERTGITAAGSVVVDVELETALGGLPALDNFGACWGFLNAFAAIGATGELTDLRIRVQESSSAFTGPYVYDSTQDIRFGELISAAPRQTWFLRSMSSPQFSASSIEFRNRGGNQNLRYVRLTFSRVVAIGTWTLRLGRIVRLSGLCCDISPSPVRSSVDQSEVIRSYSGRPFVRAATITSGYSGTIVGLTDREVYGVFASEPAGAGEGRFAPALSVIQRTAGISKEVGVIERASAASTSSIWQTQPVFGLFSDLPSIDRVTSTQNGDGISNCRFAITQSPLS